MKTMALIAVLCGAATAGMAWAQQPAATVVEVFRSPTCGCCLKWVGHLRDSGFQVRVKDLEQEALDKVKADYGIPVSAQSCHTARVGGYTVEGHVPAADVRRLLKEKPAVAGIAVAGMPAGSPGMEVSGGRKQPFNVVSFTKAGATQVFASY